MFVRDVEDLDNKQLIMEFVRVIAISMKSDKMHGNKMKEIEGEILRRMGGETGDSGI